MNEYIFYTTEGYTQDPKGHDVANGQLIGRAFGDTPQEARQHLLSDNPWIAAHHYDTSALICKELAPHDNAAAIISHLKSLLTEAQLTAYHQWLDHAKI